VADTLNVKGQNTDTDDVQNITGLPRIVGFAIHNWRMTLSIMFFAVIGGLLAMGRLSLDAEPDVPVPFVNVRVVLPGISPEDAERLLIRPMETELKSIEGLKEINGIASTNVAYVNLEFDINVDKDVAIAEVLEKVDRARAEFPAEAREPVVEEVSFSALPILTVNLWGDAPERELQKRAKDLQRRIESIQTVLEANISGERTDVLEAILDPSTVESLGITFEEIASAVSRNNSLIPAGALETDSGKFNVKLPGLIKTPEDMSELVVRRSADGAVIASPDWPKTINMSYSQARSVYINDMMSELFASIVNAVILVFIVCIAALGWRSALFVGWAIPASFLIAFFLFYVGGETINMMILFGLILSVGVLVDSAIVIVEFADRKMDEGLPRLDAFKMAGERMFWPIISSTATTLAAFLPLLFWDDVTGKFMSYFPRTMIYVLSASTVMALIFLPVLGAKIGFRPKKQKNENAALLAAGEGDPSQVKGITGVYVRLIKRLVHYPFLVLAVMFISLFIIVKAFGSTLGGEHPKPIEFFTQSPSDQLFVLARARGNTTPTQVLEIGRDIENRIQNIRGIESVYTVAGDGASGGGGNGGALTGPTNVPSDTVVKVYTELLPFDERRSVASIVTDLEQAVSDIPGVLTEVTAIDQGPPIGKDIGLQISTEDKVILAEVTEQVRTKLASIDGIIDIEDSRPLPGVDWELVVDRAEAGRLGLDIGRIGAAVQFVTEGALVGQYRPLDAEEEVDIRIRYPKSARDLASLDALRIQTSSGSLPLSSVVKRVAKPRQDKIERRDLLPFYIVQANTAEDFATNIQVEALQEWLETEADIPPEVKVKFLGQQEENESALAFFKAAGLAPSRILNNLNNSRRSYAADLGLGSKYLYG